jgi:hypothetical protein
MLVQAVRFLYDAPGLGRKLQCVFNALVRERLLSRCHDREREDQNKREDNQASHHQAKLLFLLRINISLYGAWTKVFTASEEL